MWTRIFLSAMALMYAAFGIWSLLDPSGMTQQLGVIIDGPNGTFEIRGVFGGVSLGAACLCVSGALQERLKRPALYFILTYMGGYCFARIASVLLGDFPEPETWRFVAFEAASFILALFALRSSNDTIDDASK